MGWYLEAIQRRDRFDAAAVNATFKSINYSTPPTSVYLPRMADRRPPLLLKDNKGYRLEARTRRHLDDILNHHPTTVVVSALLQGLSSRVSDGNERVYLDETIKCYRAGAFRATVVMAWNLCYDHVRKWILADASRLGSFHGGYAKRFPKDGATIADLGDISGLKESEFIDCCARGGVISKNIENIMREKLRRRNAAAHPSSIKILQSQADDAIIDLVENIVLSVEFKI